MELTGKAKEDFELWIVNYFRKNRKDYDQYIDQNILRKYERKTFIEKNAFIMSWLDTVGIYVQHWCSDGGNGEEFDADICAKGEYFHLEDFYSNRLDAIESALIKANEIYNG